jgi:hypothetical protein
MKRLGFVILALIIAAPSLAAPQVRGVTVGELAELLSHARGERDAKLARRLSGLMLTQRVSAARLAQWSSEFRGKHTQQALTELADASAFLDLPASDIATQASPDAASLRQILLRSIDYVNKTNRKLPDFYALRRTTSFENSAASAQDRELACNKLPGLLIPCMSQARANAGRASSGETPFHVAGQFSAIVTYVDGEEIHNGKPDSLSLPRSKLGLVSTGEFGPILTVTLGDALHGKMYWKHWERSDGGLLAVFRYEVPAARSHYIVELPSATDEESVKPAYRGEIAIAPNSGAIYRITMIANPEQENQNLLTAIMVEYGSVVIGGMPYVCPLRAVALSRLVAPDGDAGAHSKKPPPMTRLNDITFTRYHLFRAEVKIVPDAGANPPAPAPSTSPAH